MLKPICWNSLSKEQQESLLERPNQQKSADLTRQVKEIINIVKDKGDKALFNFTKQFDKVELESFQVSPEEFNLAFEKISPKVLTAFEQAISQIKTFHQKQLVSDFTVETSKGIRCQYLVRPIQKVGLYIPAGTAPLVSSIFMLGVPALLANCPLRIMCSPPNSQGQINPNILVAAKLCGIEQVFKVGGAQAIAAMANGTESIPKVDKIFGPGNAFVTTAKMLVSLDPKGASMDMPAGPSEVMVIADEFANPAFVASDLLSQAEHGVDSQVILICTSLAFAKAVNTELKTQLATLSRASIARQSLRVSVCIVVENMLEAIAIVNDYAPEHLILQVQSPDSYLPNIYKAASVFLGPWSAESAGDYASGTTHVLPTAGFARSYSGLSLRDFIRTMSVQELTQEGLASIAQTINVLTDIEGLDAHQNAIAIRLSKIRGAR